MNIIVKTSTGRIVVRPDTTWERDNEDFFPPEFVSRLSYAPVLFARICKPGRSVAEKFAGRYYDGVNYGVLLYPENMVDGSEESFACASCLDHTSFLPFPVFTKVVMGEEDNWFRLYKGRKLLFKTNEGTLATIEKALSEASQYVYLRSGDILAIELDARKELCTREDRKVQVRGEFCKNRTMEFNIIL